MSIKVMHWVWENGPADPTQRLVLLALADHADDCGRAFPSMARIAAKSCVTERGARGIVRRLEDGGWVETQIGGGRGGKSLYRIIMQNPEPETRNRKPGMTYPETYTRSATAQNPEHGAIKPGTDVPPNRQGTIKQPSLAPRKRRDEDGEVLEILCQAVPAATAEAFIAHRKAKRAKLTVQAARLIVRSLVGHPDPTAEIERSIMQGWTGVFPRQIQPQGQAPSFRIQARLPHDISTESTP